MGDEAIRNAVRDALLADTAFAEIALFEHDAGRLVAVQQPSVHGRTGEIRIRVEDGVVTLEGEVPGLGLKRLAGVLAWWVPGSRDVVNGLGVAPPEADNDGEVADAVRIALEKDPFVDAGQIRVHARNWRVILEGLVRGEAEREMAEFDAWYVSGVDAVDNRIAVRA
jgi:osmotically-inducible protein OsmY